MQDLTSEVMRRVGDEMRILDSALVTGTGISSMDRYQRLVGERDGLQKCLNIIDEILTERDETE